MTTIYENQSIAFTDLSGNTATISPAVGFTITTPTQTLTANVNGFTNGVQSLLFSDIYTTVNKTDWTGTIKTLYTNLNATHYINFSDSSATGQGNPQKSTLLSVNPSLGTITCTALNGVASSALTSGAIATISDNTAGTYYIPFSKTTANLSSVLYVDDVTGPLSYNPSTSTLSCTLLSGFLIQPTTQNTATYTSPTLSINGSSSSYKNSNIAFSGSSNTISALTLTNMIVGGEYNLGIYNGGSGNLTINTGLGANIKTIHSSGVNISGGAYGLMKINVLTINALTIYIVQVNQLT